MGSVNGQSVREEAERIKAEFQRIATNKKLDPEISMLMQSMFMLINLLIAIFLERTTKKNNKNSNIPSSQTEKDESATAHAGANSKGQPESEAIASNTRTIETVTLAPVTQCDICGQDLTNTPCQKIERRTKIDIIFEKVVEHIAAEVKYCKNCDTTVKGKFPSNMSGPLQYGNGLKAYIINLLVCQMISLNRVQKLVRTIMGVVIAEASMLQFVLRLYQALEPWEVATTATLLTSLAMNVDETSLRVERKNFWIHVYSAGDITLKFLHSNRGKAAIEDVNIIPQYGGTIIHDCWASYLSYDNCGHGLCGSHIVRELAFIIESNGYSWAMQMKELLLKTCKRVSKRAEKKLTVKEYAKLQQSYRSILTAGAKELPEIPARPNGKRGKIAKSDAHNLWERLSEHESAALLFANKSEVPFTNNRAERDLRMAKAKQKVSGCFRTTAYAKAYCRISSYLQTMANKGYNPLIAVHRALVGDFS